MEGRREVDCDSVGGRGWEGERTWEGRGEGWKRREGEGERRMGYGEEGRGGRRREAKSISSASSTAVT